MSATSAVLQWSLKILLRSEYNEVAWPVVVHHLWVEPSRKEKNDSSNFADNHQPHFTMMYEKDDASLGQVISPLSLSFAAEHVE